MAVRYSFCHRVHQHLQFGRCNASVAQAFGHRGDAAQLVQGLEHDELRFLDAVGGYGLLYLLVVVGPPLLVEPRLFRRHLYIEAVVDAVGQLRQDLFLQATEQEGVDLPAKALHRFLVVVFLDGVGIAAVEVLQTAEHGRIEKTEQRIEFRQVVLDGSAAQRQAMGGIEQQHRLCDLCPRILDVLALVQHHIMELLLGELFHIVAHDGVGSQYQLAFLGLLQVAGRAVIGIDRQLRGETLQLRLPVEQQAARHDDE